jgi:hypothetical protein
MNAPMPLMDRYSRNARLYGTLVGMGLVVKPIPSNADPEKIEYFYVSSELPAVVDQTAENSAVAGIGDTMQGPKVGNIVGSTERSGDGVVVVFPAIR